jgi:hypothetical protein
MRNTQENFSQIVCSSPDVRAAFDTYRPMRIWWRLVLALHGKPLTPTLSAIERTTRIAAGFRFYASLYRFLAVIFLLLAPTFALLNVAENASLSQYWAGASLFAGIYLWGVSGFGYVSAKSYRTGALQGTVSLIAFMVMIVAFLSLFVAAISVAVGYITAISALPNLVAVALLFVLGVGSYMIEIVYLATAPTTKPAI